MELTHDFRVPLPVPEAWDVLTDIERIAPCMPGAQLTEVDGEEYRGTVKVKVGPITAQYKGTAHFAEQSAEERRAVLKAQGRDTRGQGNASATITATLAPDGDGTAVSLVTDLAVTGKVAQFGRGVLADVSSKLLSQFVDCLEGTLAEPGAETGTAPDGAPPSGPRRIEGPEARPVDLVDAAGGSIAKRVGPVVGLVALLWLLRQLLRRRRG
jgi:uncharacterized protein